MRREEGIVMQIGLIGLVKGFLGYAQNQGVRSVSGFPGYGEGWHVLLLETRTRFISLFLDGDDFRFDRDGLYPKLCKSDVAAVGQALSYVTTIRTPQFGRMSLASGSWLTMNKLLEDHPDLLPWMFTGAKEIPDFFRF